MKYHIVYAFLLLCLFQLKAQTTTSEPMEEGVVIWQISNVKYDNSFPYNQRNYLNDKIKNILSKSGIIADKYGTGFIEISIQSSTDKVNVGMKKITSAEILISLLAKESVNGTVLASTEIQCISSGKDANRAYQQAVKKLKSTRKLEKFMHTANENYISNIAKNCNQYLADAQRQSQLDNPNQALAILAGMSTTGDCAIATNTQLEQTLKAVQQQNCSSILLNSKSQIAAGLYQKAIASLSKLNGNEPCMQEANQLAEQMRDNIKTDRLAELDALKTAWANPLSGMNLRQSVLMYLKD